MFDARRARRRAPAARPLGARAGVRPRRATSNESGTNVQEAGVDEPDVVKIAGCCCCGCATASCWRTTSPATSRSRCPRPASTDARGNGWVGDPGGELSSSAAAPWSSAPHRTAAGDHDHRPSTSPTRPRRGRRRHDRTTAALSAARLHGDVVRVVLADRAARARLLATPTAPSARSGAALRNRALVRRHRRWPTGCPTRRRRAARRLRRRRGPRRRRRRARHDHRRRPSTRPTRRRRPRTAVATDSRRRRTSPPTASTSPPARRSAGWWGDCMRLPQTGVRRHRRRHHAALRLRPRRAPTRRTSPPARSRARSRTAGRWTRVDGVAAGRGRAEQRDRQLQLGRHPARGRRRRWSRPAASTTSASTSRSSRCAGSTTSRSW